jgi:hypothetical protein
VPTLALCDVVSAIEPFAAGRWPSAWRGEAILLGLCGTGKDAANGQTEEQKGDNHQPAICAYEPDYEGGRKRMNIRNCHGRNKAKRNTRRPNNKLRHGFGPATESLYARDLRCL